VSKRRFGEKLRSVLFWTHLTLGVSGGIIVLILSLSGMLLGYERQMLAWIDGTPLPGAVPGAVRMPLDSLLARAAIDRADIASIDIRTAAGTPVMVRFRERTRLPAILDPYTGASLPLPKLTKTRKAFTWIRTWHLFLAAPEGGRLRVYAQAAMGVAMLALVLTLPIGVYLWWPVTWNAASLRATVLFRRGLSGRARDFNWHNVVGFWSAIPLFLVALTAVFLAYQWPTRWLDRALGSPAEKAAAIAAAAARPVPSTVPAPSAEAAPKPPVRAAFVPNTGGASPSLLFAAVAAMHPDWQLVVLNMPTASQPAVQVTVAEGNTFRPDLQASMILDAVTAAPVTVRTWDSLSVSRKLRSWVRRTHTGEAFGIGGQTIATLASAAGVLLALTGLTLALRRFSRWRASAVGQA